MTQITNTLTERAPANLLDRLEMAALAQVKECPAVCRLKAPLVSFSFDDAPKSAVTIGASMLENAGAKGTFYLTGSHCDANFEGVEQYNQNDVISLANAGHEIACHSFSHMRFRGLSNGDISRDLNQNQAFFRNVLKSKAMDFDSFAYPYGEFDRPSRAFAGERFLTSRGVSRGVNHGQIDLANLKAVPLELRRFSTNYLARHLKNAVKKNGWIIFFTHDIDENCTPFGSNPQILAEAIDAVKALEIEIVTVREGAKRILARA